MAWTNVANGTQTMVVGTEQTLVTSTSVGTFYAQARCNNLQNGDVVEFRIYTMTLTGGTLEVTWKDSVGPSLPIETVKAFPPQPSIWSYRVTVKQTAGTARALDWRVDIQ